jgi:hypothetical protein
LNRSLGATLVTTVLLTGCSMSVGSGGTDSPKPSVDRQAIIIAELCSDASQAVEVAMGIGGPNDLSTSSMLDDLDRNVADLRVAGQETLADATASLRDAVAETRGRGALVRVFFIDQSGRGAVNRLEDVLEVRSGVVSVTYHSEEETLRVFRLLTEGAPWAQDVSEGVIPAELSVELEPDARDVPKTIAIAREARGVRDVSTGGVLADPVAIATFRRAVVDACPGIELWPRPPKQG